jgi:hypothetical protein
VSWKELGMGLGQPVDSVYLASMFWALPLGSQGEGRTLSPRPGSYFFLSPSWATQNPCGLIDSLLKLSNLGYKKE